MKRVFVSPVLLLTLLVQGVAFAQPTLEAHQFNPQMQQRHLIIINEEPTASSNASAIPCDSTCQNAAKKSADAAWMAECQALGSSYSYCSANVANKKLSGSSSDVESKK